MKTSHIALALVLTLSAVPASAKCSDEIKALQDQAKGKDAATKPGSQDKSTSPGTMPSEGGGRVSASAKILEAQAHDEKRDEAACMRAIEEAKATISN